MKNITGSRNLYDLNKKTEKKKVTGVIRYVKDKWGDPLQCPHRIGDGAFFRFRTDVLHLSSNPVMGFIFALKVRHTWWPLI